MIGEKTQYDKKLQSYGQSKFCKITLFFYYFFFRLSSNIYPLHEKFSSDRAKIFQKVFKDKKTNSRKILGSNVKKLQKNREKNEGGSFLTPPRQE